MSEDRFNRRLTDKLQESIEMEMDSFELPTNDHNNEMWLISYSDMMTLLFGLFVMMYTIAMETKGQPDKILSDIASGRNSMSEIQNQLKQKELEVEKMRVKNLDLNEKLIKQIEQMKLMTMDTNHFKSIAQELQDKLQVQSQQEKNNENPKLINNNINAKLNRETEVLKNKVVQNLQLIEDLTNKLNRLKTENFAMSIKNTDYIKELDNLKKTQPKIIETSKSTNFMIVVLNWLTPLHDIDLRVINPLGRLFDFQNRTYKDTKAKFVVDSRTGPGVEMWETQEIEPGDYLIEFYFYNTYGNETPAKLNASIITRKGVYEFPMVELDFKTSRKKTFKIHTQDTGEISILPQM